ncbi:PD-(D/E)XK motif protein [Demequina sediminicola]|uniref:PD-(D/E)XK motif protein n=1 Tax=Demequina sediminicola TaxID=1095026 RepID=UPI0007808C7A|nr:PD-(D/E)XK motif protein [Demequina sediminicola]
MAEARDYTLDPQYEWLREKVERLTLAKDGHARVVQWVDSGHKLGLSRDSGGRVEIFLAGPPLHARSPIVQKATDHDNWSSSAGGVVRASRVRLPNAPHFDRVAAFISAELLAAGINDNVQQAYSDTEALIALAFERSRTGSPFLLGLAGELLFLRAMLLAARPGERSYIVAAWKGPGRTTRDFQMGSVGVEVKTTTAAASRHHINGIAQIECGISVDEVPETDLFLLSVGLKWLDLDVSYGESLPGLVESILAMLDDASDRQAFETAVAEYGDLQEPGAPGVGSPDWKRPFHTTFERLYDLADGKIHLPSSQDLVDYVHLDIDSLRFRISLPDQIDGDLNPLGSLESAASKVLVLLRKSWTSG